MELTLTYEGRIPAQRKDLDVIWAMRLAFNRQLEKAWGSGRLKFLRIGKTAALFLMLQSLQDRRKEQPLCRFTGKRLVLA